MFDPIIRMIHTQRQSSSGSHSSNHASNHLGSADALPGALDDKRTHSLMKRVRELENSLEKTNKALKMTGAEGANVDQKRTTGGKGTRGKSGQVPPALVGTQTHFHNAQPICFDYNLVGCPQAKDGERCSTGWHVCSSFGCQKPHTLLSREPLKERRGARRCVRHVVDTAVRRDSSPSMMLILGVGCRDLAARLDRAGESVELVGPRCLQAPQGIS